MESPHTHTSIASFTVRINRIPLATTKCPFNLQPNINSAIFAPRASGVRLTDSRELYPAFSKIQQQVHGHDRRRPLSGCPGYAIANASLFTQ